MTAVLAPPQVQNPKPVDRDFIRLGRSKIEGTGVFAKRRIPRGARIIEYTGDRVPIDAPVAPPGAADADLARTYRLGLDATTVIDGAKNGNEARFVNHSCDPNCEMYVFDSRAYLYPIRDLRRGEELTFDYRLAPADPTQTGSLDEPSYRCRCRAPKCRGTLLAPRLTLLENS